MSGQVQAAGVFAVSNYGFKIGPAGATKDQLMTVKDVNSLQPKVKSTIKNWSPMDQAGWERNLVTGKSMSMDMKGQRNYGDPGNDFIAGKLLSIGQDCNAVLEIDFPNGDELLCNGVIDISSPFGGASTDADTLEWSYTVDGKPQYIPFGSETALTFSSVPVANATGVAITASPTLTFSNALSDYSNVALVKASDGSGVTFTPTLDNTGKILTLKPTVSLTAGTEYEIILAGVKDLYGHALATQVILFTTAAS